ncbi:ribose-phosphate diphosphokinase family member [Holotrichia oblita]|nr:ribose-phosphate diphosphokinase family member [Holotrichia oblita]
MVLSGGNRLKLFAGNGCPMLAAQIAKRLDVELGTSEVTKFSDGEVSVHIKESVRGTDVYVIQSTSNPVNDNLMELLVMLDAFKRASAGRINAVIPYFGYARQDRKAIARDPITAKLVADLIQTAGADRVLTMDLHAAQIQGFFDIPVDHLYGIPVLKKVICKESFTQSEDFIVVSPDVGSVARARQMAARLNAPLAIVDKRRPKPNEMEVMSIIGDVKGKTCLIMDDMIDTAGTIVQGAKALVERGGAEKVYACCTHGVLSGPAIERLKSSVIEKVFVLDTIQIPEEKKFDKLIEVSVAPIFAEAIESIHLERPISKLFYPLDLSLSGLPVGECGRVDYRSAVASGMEQALKNPLKTRGESSANGEGGISENLVFRDFKQLLSGVSLAEDIRLVISEGEYVSLGKYIAKSANLKHIICGGGNLSAYDFMAGTVDTDNSENICEMSGLSDLVSSSYSSGLTEAYGMLGTSSLAKVFETELSNPAGAGFWLQDFGGADAIINDSENINVPSGFAFVLSSYLALFDWDISALLFGGNMCSAVFKEAQKTVNRLMEAAGLFGKRSTQLKKAVLEAQLSMAALIETAGPQLLLSGASQAAAALTALYRHEERPLIDFFDITFLFSPAVAKIYAAFLDQRIPFSFPPDNNFRAGRLAEYLGMDEAAAYKLMPAYIGIKNIEITDYRLGVYRDELLRHIYGVIRVLDAAYPVYFKLCSDDGFSLKAELINRVGNEAEEIILVALPQADYTAYYYISATINCYQITNLGIQKKLWNAEQEKEETVYMLFPVHTISNSDTQPSVEENKECVTETFDYFAEFYRKGAKNNNTVIDEENKTIIFTNIYNDKVSMHWSEDFNGDFWIEFN